MKKLLKKALICLMTGVLALSCTGCITGTVYGKPLDETRDVDDVQASMFMSKIMEAMQKDSLDEINQLGYHYGQEDAETFEAFWESWQQYKPVYGQIEGFSLSESYQYGNEMVFVFLASMEKGEMQISAMYTSYFELVMLYLYETGEAALAGAKMPDEVAEEAITLGADTEYPVAAKLTYPKGAQAGDQLPAVVLVGGDGPNTVDLKAGNTYLYRDLAWGLAQQGIASIRYDKKVATYREQRQMADAPAELFTVAWEYTDDALAATELLRSKPYVNAEQIYYIGHSQGATVAPRADAQGGNYAGMVLLSSSPRPWYDVIYDQYINYGLIDQDDEKIYYLVSKMEAERDFLAEAEYNDMDEEELLGQFVDLQPAYFWKDFFSFDYLQAMKDAQKPTLILQGDASFQITKDVDFAAWQQELAGADWATLKSYEGLNFYFTPSQGCFAGHYKEFDMPGRVPEQVIQDIASWILKGHI